MNEVATQKDKAIHVFGRPLGLVLIVVYKAMWGMMEIVAGILLILSQHIVAEELAEDPQDLTINWLLSHVHVDYRLAVNAGVVFIALGLVKLVLAAGIWSRSWRFRTVAVVFFALVAVFGAYQLLMKYTILRLLTLSADLFILFYLWKILPRHLRDRAPSVKP